MERRIRLIDLFPDSQVLGDDIQTLPQVVTDMLTRLIERGVCAESVPEILQKVLQRETLGSTAIGNGVAVPHARTILVEKLITTLAITPHGIDCQSLDGEPVYIFVLLLAPPLPVGAHLSSAFTPEAETVQRVLRNAELLAKLRNAKTESEIRTILQQINTRDDDF